MEASSPLEKRSSNSSRESYEFKTLFPHRKDGEGAVVPPHSVMRMRVKKEEVSFYTINFASETSRHEKLDSWAETILAQPRMKKKLNELGIMRAISQARKMVVDKN